MLSILVELWEYHTTVPQSTNVDLGNDVMVLARERLWIQFAPVMFSRPQQEPVHSGHFNS